MCLKQLKAEITQALRDGLIRIDEHKKIEVLRQRLSISQQGGIAKIDCLSGGNETSDR